MDAAAAPVATSLRARIAAARRRVPMPAVEIGVAAAAVAVAIGSYFLLTGQDATQRLLTPPLVALLLVANLIPNMALLVLLGRRIARRRAAKLGGGGRLHVRLVGLFSLLASVPMLLVTVFASLMFQYGVEFWLSDRARGMLENAQSLAQQSYQDMLSYVDNENLALAIDIRKMLFEYRWPIDSAEFIGTYAQDVYQRSLAESVVFQLSPGGEIKTLVIVNPGDRNLTQDIDAREIARLRRGTRSVVSTSAERTKSITSVPGTDMYVYSARYTGAQQMAQRMNRARSVLSDYQALVERSRSLQLQFNGALLIVSLLIVGLAVFVALAVADRLVRPVGSLVDAASRVARGDLSARVPSPESDDEIGTLATAFNRMTGRLQEQTNALVTANAEAESRRALIEAVMAGVTAGIVSVGADGTVRLVNASALALLKASASPVGRPLAEVAPELEAMMAGGAREGIVQLVAGGEARTLAVKVTRDEGGHILTFDDITQQLLDQRRAAWSDVARRIAHEIKNPLTPIQLAAERLQRRFGKLDESGDGTFARLTETIVRQVGDLRRMVDEFSSFARMPKPVFRPESLVDLGRQALFLHEVAKPEIGFRLDAPDPAPNLVCDRRQIGQALTNIVKNAVEAIEARGPGAPRGEIVMTLTGGGAEADGRVTLSVADNGIGLPVERDRIVEPYMTTRARGTGLGLAIVKKIVEEHFGTIAFADRPGGGTVVTLGFDAAVLAPLAGVGDGRDDDGGDASPRVLTRNQNGPSA